MKILLTGGSGYVGTCLRRKLGHIYSFINYDIKNNPKDDVRDLARLERAVRGVSGVIHLAAISRPKVAFIDPHTCLTTNIGGTANVLEAVRKKNPKAWVVFSSSREVYGGHTKFPVTEKSLRLPLNAYAVSKVAGEDLMQQYARNYGLRALILRFCGVYTGADDILDRVIPRFIILALKNKPITLEGNGKKKMFDFVYIDDVINGVNKTIGYVKNKPNGFCDDFTLSANNPISLYDLAKLIIKITESRSKIVNIPERSYDVSGFWGSYTKAKKHLGWEPKVNFENGLVKSIKEIIQRIG
ncbi:MAG: GDP-mannose 4,6-dehydratase [bacterium]|nr:GDP-mannose 4,6-dehydratase [bacterium]